MLYRLKEGSQLWSLDSLPRSPWLHDTLYKETISPVVQRALSNKEGFEGGITK